MSETSVPGDLAAAGDADRAVGMTVVIPAHNCEQYIEETIASVEAQTLPPVEVIVVENASSDGSRELIAQLAEESHMNIRLVTTDCPGVSNARNLGFSLAHTPLVAMLDADDRYLPGFLRSASEAFSRQPSLCLFFGNRRPLRDGEVVDEPFLERTGLPSLAFTPLAGDSRLIRDGLFELLLRGSVVSCSGAVVRRSAAYRAGLFPVSLNSSEDRCFFSRLALEGPAAYTLAPTHHYRSHPASKTGSSGWLEIRRNMVRCLAQLQLDTLERGLTATQREALQQAFSQALAGFHYSAADNGLASFLDARAWSRRAGLPVTRSPKLWLKAVKNSIGRQQPANI